VDAAFDLNVCIKVHPMSTPSLSLPRATPESQGIPSEAIQRLVAGFEHVPQPHSFMLARHGRVVAEGWWHPYRPAARHMLFSLSKCFASTAIGLAVAEGRLGLDDPVVSFFPDEAPRKRSPHLEAMTVRHLLTMTTGHAQDVTEVSLRRRDRRAVYGFLKQPVAHAPGTYFVYNSAATFVLSAIVQKLSGQTLLEFLTPRLLEPLGIHGATWESYPNHDGAWINFGGWGLSTTTEDIVRFGQLYLQGGMWEGRALIPADWVAAATAAQVPNGPGGASDWAQGYGFQFWRCQPAGVYRGDGAFGQLCVVMPGQGAVLAATAGLADMQAMLNIIWAELLPAMAPDPLPEDPVATAALQHRLATLALSPAIGVAAAGAGRPVGPTYEFPETDQRLRSISFDFNARQVTYEVARGRGRRQPHRLTYGDGVWVDGESHFEAAEPSPVAVCGAWRDANTFELTVCHYETPFIGTYRCRFEGEAVVVTVTFNVAFGPTERAPITGHRAGQDPTP
jgi:CubicO group peptidase (beta-lactamase class C family)